MIKTILNNKKHFPQFTFNITDSSSETRGTTFDFSGNVSAQTQQPKRGDSVTIYCETATFLTETLNWFKNGVNIDELMLQYTVAGNSLNIQSYDIEYDGFYHCVARYDNTSNSSAVQIQASPPIVLSSYGTLIIPCTNTFKWHANGKLQ